MRLLAHDSMGYVLLLLVHLAGNGTWAGPLAPVSRTWAMQRACRIGLRLASLRPASLPVKCEPFSQYVRRTLGQYVRGRYTLGRTENRL